VVLKHLGPDHPVYGLQSRGLAKPAPLPKTMEDMSRFRDFRPGGFRGDVTFFTATLTQNEIRRKVDAWLPYVDGRLVNHEIACRHEHMMQAGPIAEIGPLLAARLGGMAVAM
jgi:thioesterase domain-containing protein